jgi:hypothetical protein
MARPLFAWMRTWPPMRAVGGYWSRIFPAGELSLPPDQPPDSESEFEHIERVDHLEVPRSTGQEPSPPADPTER